MSATPALRYPVPGRLSPHACPFCKGNGAVRYRTLTVDLGDHVPTPRLVAAEGVEPCEACDGVGWPGLFAGGVGLVVRESARVYQLHAPRFPLGLIVATQGALALARRHGVDVPALLRRHRAGDWGDVGPEDALANDLALDPACPARLLSAYDTPGGRLWVITEADRSATTVLLPSEY